jgi:hypothetical protein
MIGITLPKNSRQDDFMANSIYQKFFSFWRKDFDSLSHKMNHFAASRKMRTWRPKSLVLRKYQVCRPDPKDRSGRPVSGRLIGWSFVVPEARILSILDVQNTIFRIFLDVWFATKGCQASDGKI